MSSHAFTLSKFYKDMGDVDPDFRQTGLWDLSRELEQKGSKMNISDSDQDKIVQIVIKALNETESHSDVHANAIQVLVHLTPRVREQARIPLIRDLARCVHGDVKAQDPRFPLTTARIASLRDNAGIALKNIIEASQDNDIATGEAILKSVFTAFDKITEIKTKSEALDVGSCVIKQYGSNIKHEAYAPCFTAARSCIDARDWGLRRRALLVVAQLSLYIPQDDFNGILEEVISGLNKSGETFRNRAQLASAISQRAGSRFAARVRDIIRLLSEGISKIDEDDSPESDDIRENILHAYEHIVCQCAGSVVAEDLGRVVSDAVRMLDWDPNFACDDPLDEGDMPLSQDSGEVYDGMMCREGTVTSFDEVVDESDDSSWKVRRASAHCLSQILRARPDSVCESVLFSKLFKVGNPVFLTRLRDRVESVQQEVCSLLFGLFEVSQSTGSLPDLGKRANPLVRTLLGALKGSVASVKPNIGAACLGNMRTAFALFKGAEWEIISKASGALQRAISSPSFASPVLKPEAMRAACAVMSNLCDTPDNANESDLWAVFGPLAQFILDGVSDRSIKTSSTAVASTAVLVRLALKFPGQAAELLKKVFATLEASLAKADVDHEVKRTAIETTCSSLLAAAPAADLVAAIPDIAPRLVKVTIELSKNDGLRSAALPMLAVTAHRLPLQQDAVKQIVAECTSLLKKADRQVREGALRSLNGVLSAHGATVGDVQANEIVKLTASVSSILSESELFLAVLCLQMLRSAVLVSKAAAATLAGSSLLADALSLTKSALQQATSEISELLAAVVRADSSLVSKVFTAALGVAAATTEARVLPHVAQVLAAIVAADIATGGKGGAKKHLDELVANSNKSYAIPLFGELGRNTDLSSSCPQALTLLKKKLDSGSDEEKTMASTALGRVASSAHNQSLLAELMAKLSAGGDENTKYFILRALREAVNSAVHDATVRSSASGAAAAGTAVGADAAAAAASSASSAVPANFAGADKTIAEPLLKLSSTLHVSDDSVTIPLVSECLGRTALLVPDKIVPMLVSALGASDAPEPTALCVSSGMRYVALASSSKPNIRAILSETLSGFIANGLDAKQSHRVRRAALLLLGTGLQIIGVAAFNVKADLPKLLKLVEVDKTLQVRIDVGLFVHVKDAGLEMRRAAFEALAVLCQPAQVAGSSAKVLPIVHATDNKSVVIAVANAMGLTKDESEPDLQVSARSILLKLADIPAFASEILGSDLITKIADELRKAIITKVKDGADPDATKENARSAALTALKLAPRAVHCAKLAEACTAIKTAPLIGGEYDSLVARAKDE